MKHVAVSTECMGTEVLVMKAAILCAPSWGRKIPLNIVWVKNVQDCIIEPASSHSCNVIVNLVTRAHRGETGNARSIDSSTHDSNVYLAR